VRRELEIVISILAVFGHATGLRINIGKCYVAPIRCGNIDLEDVLLFFAGERVSFPVQYLRLPLALGQLRYVHLQPVLGRARAHLAAWKRKWVNADGRKALVSSVLSSLPIFALTALKWPVKLLKDFDRIRRNFVWDIEEDKPTGGKCKTDWRQVQDRLEAGLRAI
jgi:hypothetical protein